jgi:radical SAM family RiPP maturation amino acid epimerase
MTEVTDGAFLDTLLISRVSRIKRFLERWACDDAFRAALAADARGAAAAEGYEIDPEDVRPLWDESYFGCEPEEVEARVGRPLPRVTDYEAVRSQKRRLGEKVKQESAPLDPAFRAWRDRQVRRAETEFSRNLDAAILHPTFAFELSKGCSVGCWFCGVDAPRLGGHFLYTAENAALWAGIMEAVRDLIGTQAGRRNFLYWASDPLDNPDYEQFAGEFMRVFGSFPHTTTAQAHRHLERVRALLPHTGPASPFLIRFSILSVAILKKIHDYFTPEELAFIELVPQTPGAILKKTRAGRARKSELSESKETQISSDEDGRTIACVSGFLVNMVERTIRLATPCAASERWPLGYRVIEERSFTDARDFAAAARAMVGRHMPLAPPAERRLSFRPELSFEPRPDGFTLAGRSGHQSFSGPPLAAELGSLIASGRYTPGAIGAWFRDRCGLGEELTGPWLSDLFMAGVLEESDDMGVLADAAA